MKFLILFFLLTISAYSQIIPYILPEDFGDKKKGDTIYVMNKETRDDLYEIMYDNLMKDTLIDSYEVELAAAKRRLIIRDSIDIARKQQDSIRQIQISNLENDKFFNIKGIFVEGNATYIPKAVPLYELGVFMNIDIKNILTINPGFKAVYLNPDIYIGPTIRVGVRIY